MPSLLLAALLTSTTPAVAARWEVRFFHDANDSELTILDLAFPSARRGVATGYLTLRGGKIQPRAVITSDGGAHWSLVPLKEVGRSLFFLNETIGWMVSPKGIWQTLESGRGWRKVSQKRGILRLWFLDRRHGFAVGEKKAIYETHDGGQHWKPVPAAAEPKTTKEFTSYDWVEFANPRQGTIVGYSEPPRRNRSRFPDWMDPERAARRREWPSLTIVLQTNDGGRSWKPSTTSIFGRIVRVRTGPDGRALILVRFRNSFEWPSEVYATDPRTGKTKRVFRRKDRSITDVAWTRGGTAYLAGYEPTGQLLESPVPGRLVVLRSKDLVNWEEMEADYRAYAHAAMLAAPESGGVWVATDTGMILKLVGD